MPASLRIRRCVQGLESGLATALSRSPARAAAPEVVPQAEGHLLVAGPLHSSSGEPGPGPRPARPRGFGVRPARRPRPRPPLPRSAPSPVGGGAGGSRALRPLLGHTKARLHGSRAGQSAAPNAARAPSSLGGRRAGTSLGPGPAGSLRRAGGWATIRAAPPVPTHPGVRSGGGRGWAEGGRGLGRGLGPRAAAGRPRPTLLQVAGEACGAWPLGPPRASSGSRPSRCTRSPSSPDPRKGEVVPAARGQGFSGLGCGGDRLVPGTSLPPAKSPVPGLWFVSGGRWDPGSLGLGGWGVCSVLGPCSWLPALHLQMPPPAGSPPG